MTKCSRRLGVNKVSAFSLPYSPPPSCFASVFFLLLNVYHCWASNDRLSFGIPAVASSDASFHWRPHRTVAQSPACNMQGLQFQTIIVGDPVFFIVMINWFEGACNAVNIERQVLYRSAGARGRSLLGLLFVILTVLNCSKAISYNICP